ncbi:CIC11C00000004856 [Sungouiella intermedia]|uniref:CIC11C00000004856 n=1 Tax=Sungouiella intermedia TaxID=45354 RepID=A0A1L0B915_9ASCO|nr:CIC11C00000004856 [[Candida] intermedia]
MCLSIRKLHQQAREQSLNKIGYLKNTSFIRKCRRIKENVVLMENAKHELYSIVDEIQADLKDINEVTRALGGLQNQWNKAQNMFEKHHDKYSDQVYLMETYTYPLWHYFDHAARILDTDSWKIFSEFAQAEKQFKKDTAIAEDTLQEAVEHIMWGKLALLKIDCYTKDCDVWALGDEIPVVT